MQVGGGKFYSVFIRDDFSTFSLLEIQEPCLRQMLHLVLFYSDLYLTSEKLQA